MLLLPLKTPLIRPGDDLASLLAEAAMKQHPAGMQQGDIIVISSKVVSMSENGRIDLRKEGITFREAVLRETERMHGRILPGCPEAMLTEFKPEGLKEGTLLAANAGLDLSNVEEGYAIGWPRDPVESVKKLRRGLESHVKLRVTGFWFLVRNFLSSKLETRNSKLKTFRPRLAVVLSDSCCRPRRIGVTAQALTVSGIDPIVSRIGARDLFGKFLTMTQEAIADQLATAANLLMGNASEATPAVIVRDHGLVLSSFEGWVPGIESEKDLFGTLS